MNARRIAVAAAGLAALAVGLPAQHAAAATAIGNEVGDGSPRLTRSTVSRTSTVSGNRATNPNEAGTGQGGRSVALARGGGAATASPAVVLACPANTFCAQLNIAGFGFGSGRVTSDPAGIDCNVARALISGKCSYVFSWPFIRGPIYPVALTQTAAQHSFTGEGIFSPCNQPARTSVVLLAGGEDRSETTFFCSEMVTLTVSKAGSGSGRVWAEPVASTGIDCGSSCSSSFVWGDSVLLRAAADADSVFAGWSGVCTGTSPTCMFLMTEPFTTTATFNRRATPPPPPPPPSPPPPPASPPPPPASPPPPPADTSVDAEIVTARAGRSRLGVRVVQVEVSAQETVAATLTLTRKQQTLATKRFARVREGERVLTLVVGRRIAKGPATLRIVLADAAGNAMNSGRSVRLPK